MKVAEVTVRPGDIEAVVVFEPGEPVRTSTLPGVRARALALLPGLRGHRCDNDEGRPFSEELADTEVAHLVEHATLELMAMAGSPSTLRGLTTWDSGRDGRGVFRVRVACDDDLVALGALKAAESAVRWCLDGEGPSPGVEAEARRLRGLRRG